MKDAQAQATPKDTKKPAEKKAVTKTPDASAAVEKANLPPSAVPNLRPAMEEEILYIEPGKIKIEPGFNYRNFKLPANKEHLKDTTASVEVNGVIQPLWCKKNPDGSLSLIAGETRLRSANACIAAGKGDKVKKVPYILKEGDDRTLLMLSLLENTQKPPSQVEVGGAFIRLTEMGMSVKDIATAYGQKPDFVKKAIELEKTADAETKEWISKGAVSVGHALQVIRKGGNAKFVLAEQIKAAEEEAEERRQEREKAKKKAAKDGKDKGGRPAQDKPKMVKRAKEVASLVVPLDTIALVKKALKQAAKSKDVDISMPADTALEALNKCKAR